MRVLIVDDHQIVRAGLRNLLASALQAEIFEASNAQEALALLREKLPHLVLLDLNLPGPGGLQLLQRMLSEIQDGRIVVLSMHTERSYVTQAMALGAHGYLSKNTSAKELLVALKRVESGHRYIEQEIAQNLALQPPPDQTLPLALSPRELELFRLYAEGQTLSEIAGSVGVSYKTVANTFSQIRSKLGVRRSGDLIRLAIDLGLA